MAASGEAARLVELPDRSAWALQFKPERVSLGVALGAVVKRAFVAGLLVGQAINFAVGAWLAHELVPQYRSRP